MAADEEEEGGFKFDSSVLAAVLAQHYEPARSYQTADTYLTTEELYSLLREHYPGYFTREHLYLVLLGENYKQENEGKQVVWLLNKAD